MSEIIRPGKKVRMQIGGTGGLNLLDEVLNNTEPTIETPIPKLVKVNGHTYYYMPNSDGGEVHTIYPVGDSGGHTELVRSTLGTLAGGDAGHLLAMHIRNPRTRRLFINRWEEEGARKGVRFGTEFIASAEILEHSHSGGIKLLEEAFRCDLQGHLRPVSDDNYHIRAVFSDGTSEFGEKSIDDMKWTEKRNLVGIEYVDAGNNIMVPQMTPDAVESIASADYYIVCSATPEGTHGQIDNMPEYKAAHAIANPIRIGVVNAVRTPDTKHHTARSLVERYADKMGQPFDIVLVNQPSHNLPDNYLPREWRKMFAGKGLSEEQVRKAAEQFVFMPNDLKENTDLAKMVVVAPFTRVDYIGTQKHGYKHVIRHDGKVTFDAIQTALAELKR